MTMKIATTSATQYNLGQSDPSLDHVQYIQLMRSTSTGTHYSLNGPCLSLSLIVLMRRVSDRIGQDAFSRDSSKLKFFQPWLLMFLLPALSSTSNS